MLDPQRLVGFSGVTIGALTLVAVPLYFAQDGPPPAWNALTRALIGVLTCAALISFLACVRELVRRADPAYEWLASLAWGAGLVHVAVALVGMSLEAGGVFGTPDGTIDPTTDGPLAHGAILLRGSIGRVLDGLYLGVTGYTILRTAVLPRWAALSAWAIALWNLAFVPAMYFGSEAAVFYSALGWGNTALTASLFAYWAAAVGISCLGSPRRARERLRGSA